jgi:hypothetical protein
MSPREAEVLQAVDGHMNNAQIASVAHLGPDGGKPHLVAAA